MKNGKKGTPPTLTIKKEPVDDNQIDIGEFLESIGDTISPLGNHVFHHTFE